MKKRLNFFYLLRNFWMADNSPMMVGLAAACPDGDDFAAHFDSFSVKHLADQRRLEWLDKNM